MCFFLILKSFHAISCCSDLQLLHVEFCFFYFTIFLYNILLFESLALACWIPYFFYSKIFLHNILLLGPSALTCWVLCFFILKYFLHNVLLLGPSALTYWILFFFISKYFYTMFHHPDLQLSCVEIAVVPNEVKNNYRLLIEIFGDALNFLKASGCTYSVE